MKKLIAFDMDSTLVQCEVIDELAKHHNCYNEVAIITELAMKGKIDFSVSLKKRVRLLKNLSVEIMESVIDKLPYTKGLDNLFKYLKENHYITAILSGGFEPFANAIKEKLGVNYVYSNRFEIRNNVLTGRIQGVIIDANQKKKYLEKIAKNENIHIKNTVAVGDGSNDIPMLQVANIGIAFCARKKVKKVTPFHVDKADMRFVQKILEKMQ